MAKFFLWLLVPGFVLGTLHAEPASDSLAEYSTALQKKFPTVVTISPSELERMRPRPLLLDVRSENEFAVSRLPSAIRADDDILSQLGQLETGKDTPIVVYCSVGYRSSVLAEKLQAADFQNVRNLRGSIFAWANEGRPLVNANGPSTGVHPYDVTWGRYLLRENWRWKPEQNAGD